MSAAASRAPRTARVRVPASSANLGGGFDCVGVAVGCWLEAAVTIDDDATADDVPAVTIARGGTLAAMDAPAADDLLHVGFAAACAAAGVAVPRRLAYTATSAIPVSRGLGSSAAALGAGVRLANEALALGLGSHALASICARREGHGDNAGPALLGGAVLGIPTGCAGASDAFAFAELAVHASLAFVLVAPDFPVTTAAARAVLPPTVPFGDAVAAVARSASLVQGLATGDARLLAVALDDVLHVPHRRALVPGYDAVTTAARGAGAIGATLSGSGSTLCAVAPIGVAPAVAGAMRDAWTRCGVAVALTLVERPVRLDADGRAVAPADGVTPRAG